MTHEVQIAIKHAFSKLFEDGVPPPSFLDDNRTRSYGGFFELGLYFTDDDTLAGYVQSEIRNGKWGGYSWIYRGTKPAYCCNVNTTFEREFKGKQLYMASMKDNTKWRVDVEQTPVWKYDTEKWNSYFKDVFNSDWDSVGKYYYEVKSKLPYDLGSRTLRINSDNTVRWIILKDGMLMNLVDHTDKAEFDDTVTLKGIPVQYIMLHMLPRISTFASKVDVIQKLRDRIGDKYTKSVLVMQDNGDLRKYTFTSCHVYWGSTELTVDQIRQLIDNPNAWNGDSLKRLSV